VPRSGVALIMQAYRFLRAVMNTAVRDGAVMKNPCQIAGAGSDRAKERPVASPAEVVTLLEAITPRYRAAVSLAAWCGLRRGETIGLRLEDVNVGSATCMYRSIRLSPRCRFVTCSLW
jgi:integrase